MTHKHAEFIKAWLNGETVEVRTGGKWYPVADLEAFVNYRNNEFRKKPTQWYRVGLFKCFPASDGYFISASGTELGEASFATQSNFVRWLTDRVYYEV